MDVRTAIIDALDTLRKRDLSEKQPFRAKAYATVIAQLRVLDRPVTCMEDLQGVKGIGEKIEEKIREILATGQLQAAVRAREIYSTDALDAFQNIYGVGPAKAKQLVTEGFKTVEELRAAVAEGRDVLNDKQRIGLAYYEDLLERIPRKEMVQHETLLRDLLPLSMRAYPTDLVGSFRRGAPSSGDIDVLIRMPEGMTGKEAKQKLVTYVNGLKKKKYVLEILALGEHKCMAICRLGDGFKARRLDLLMTPHHEYVYSLFYFTGSDRFNVGVRQFCNDHGYTLNEHTLQPLRGGLPLPPPMETEEDLFSFLCLRWVDPTERVDASQVEMET
jgi:DNA polymerase/3'-5' exonuclease PolX